MKKILKISILALMFSLSLGSTTFAATTPKSNATPIQAVLVASVNIENAKIVFQEGNTFNISFSLSNDEGLQTGVKYGVKLVKESKDSQLVIDEKVYDESLTLNPNTVTQKEITYVASSSLSGSYTLILTSNNNSGFPFAISNLGKVTLTATSKGIQISPETCTLQIVTDKTNKKYTLIQGIGIKPEESIKLTCTAMNSSKLDITTTPSYETRYRSSYGDIIEQTGGDVAPITFKANEKKSFSVILPKVVTPQLYNINFTLVDKENKSNSISINYAVLGANVTIDNLSLDKDYYKKGEIAQVSFIYKSRGEGISTLTSNIKVLNGKGKSCAKPQSQILPKIVPPKMDTTIAITSSCIDPVISLSITDEGGTVLAQKEFKVKTTSVIPNKASNRAMIYIIIILLAIIIGYIYIKRKNTQPTNNIPMNILFPFLLLVALFSFIPTQVVKAYTYAYGSNDGRVIGTIIFDKDNYIPNENMNVSTLVNIDSAYGAGEVNTDILIEEYINLQYKSAFYAQGIALSLYNIYNNFTAPSIGGMYNATIFVSYKAVDGVPHSYYFELPYLVVAPAPTVTITATGVTPVTPPSNPLSIPYSTGVNIFWTSTNASTCTCTYNGTPGDCGSGPAFAGTDIGASGNGTYSLTQSKTFNVTCSP